jgi:diguanylate cyclase (GGDEF)-like protein
MSVPVGSIFRKRAYCLARRSVCAASPAVYHVALQKCASDESRECNDRIRHARIHAPRARLNFSQFQGLRPVLAPAAILLAVVLALVVGPALPPSLSGLSSLGPYLVLIFGAGMGAWFNRGRAFIALVSLLAAYTAYSIALQFGAASFAARAVFTAAAILVPANFLLALAFPERGVSHHFNYRWLMLAVAEILCVAWIASAGRSSLSGTVWQDLLEHWALRSPPTPLAGRLLFAAAFFAAAARAWPNAAMNQTRPLDIGLAGALVAFFIGCEWVDARGAFGAFMMAAGGILLVSLLQESHRLAFRDELTGLPSRRALEEALHGLGPVHAIAMLDVDHFKKFNDTHGHDVGDQVLKLVAARLAEVEGGGTAYRYGGEEFCVLFPGRTLAESLPHAEKIRAGIADYLMSVRKGDRPKDAETGTRLRHLRTAEKTLSVTVSIGLAEPEHPDTKPAEVIRAADQALYRAKEAGRNRVSR